MNARIFKIHIYINYGLLIFGGVLFIKCTKENLNQTGWSDA